MTNHDPDATVAVSELMGDRNPFADIPDTRKPPRRPTPSLVIGMAMISVWLIASLAQEWPAFREVSGLFLMVSFVLFVKWAKSE